jgi:hypothetical protein
VEQKVPHGIKIVKRYYCFQFLKVCVRPSFPRNDSDGSDSIVLKVFIDDPRDFRNAEFFGHEFNNGTDHCVEVFEFDIEITQGCPLRPVIEAEIGQERFTEFFRFSFEPIDLDFTKIDMHERHGLVREQRGKRFLCGYLSGGQQKSNRKERNAKGV